MGRQASRKKNPEVYIQSGVLPDFLYRELARRREVNVGLQEESGQVASFRRETVVTDGLANKMVSNLLTGATRLRRDRVLMSLKKTNKKFDDNGKLEHEYIRAAREMIALHRERPR